MMLKIELTINTLCKVIDDCLVHVCSHEVVDVGGHVEELNPVERVA